MYIKKNYRDLMTEIATMLNNKRDLLTKEETAKLKEFTNLIELFNAESDKDTEKAKIGMKKFRSTPEGKARSREASRKSAQRWREKNKLNKNK